MNESRWKCRLYLVISRQRLLACLWCSLFLGLYSFSLALADPIISCEDKKGDLDQVETLFEEAKEVLEKQQERITILQLEFEAETDADKLVEIQEEITAEQVEVENQEILVGHYEDIITNQKVEYEASCLDAN